MYIFRKKSRKCKRIREIKVLFIAAAEEDSLFEFY